MSNFFASFGIISDKTSASEAASTVTCALTCASFSDSWIESRIFPRVRSSCSGSCLSCVLYLSRLALTIFLAACAVAASLHTSVAERWTLSVALICSVKVCKPSRGV